MWGGVGRGKSFLMDSFYMIVPLQRKTRLHFHEFMREVHRELEELKGTADPLDELARRIAKRYRLICFDEFHVSDIADAMILYRLLDKLFENGVQFVMTSNYDPDTLYPDGLHRDRMLPAIELIKSKLDVINVDAGIDYRQRTLAQVEVYHTPLGAAADKALRDAFARLAAVPDESPILHIEKRELKALRKADGVVWFDFATLCGGPRSQNDYLELASRFHAVILSERAADVGAHGIGGAPLHVADRRVLRPQGQAADVGRGAARTAVCGRSDGQRIHAHGVAHRRDAVEGISRHAAPDRRYLADLSDA